MDFFNQGIPLGRWFRINVILHWTFVLYAVFEIFQSGGHAADSALVMGLLFATVLTHEFGHALSCKAVGGQADRIVLWPLGGVAFVQPPMNPRAWLITTVCGPLVNAVLWPVFYLLSRHLILERLGDYGWGLLGPTISGSAAIGFPSDFGIPIQLSVMMWQINKLLLLFNLIPAYPMDGGRILQELLWFGIGFPRSRMIAGMVGTVAGTGFIVIGLGLWSIRVPWLGFSLGQTGQNDTFLAVIGILCVMQSFAIYRHAQATLAANKA